jgi:hypothetical protein
MHIHLVPLGHSASPLGPMTVESHVKLIRSELNIAPTKTSESRGSGQSGVLVYYVPLLVFQDESTQHIPRNKQENQYLHNKPLDHLGQHYSRVSMLLFAMGTTEIS